MWSDPVTLPFVKDAKALTGRKLAVSFHVAGDSGPMTWHAKALQTSYVSAPGAGAKGQAEDEAAFPFSTASWYFVDAVDMMPPAGTQVIVGVRRLHHRRHRLDDERRGPLAEHPLAPPRGRRPSRRRWSTRGIGGNQVAGPSEYSPAKPFAGGPSARRRASSATCSAFRASPRSSGSKASTTSQERQRHRRQAVTGPHEGGRRPQIRAKNPAIKIYGATVVTALDSTSAAHGFPEQNEKRNALNNFIRTSGTFDGVIDFDQVIVRHGDRRASRQMFVPESTTGGAGDKLHPNRAGYLAMGNAIDLDMMMGKKKSTAAR